MTAPRHILEASTHPDPYAWYATLAPLAFDEALSLWIAADADVVRAALAHPALRVRPPSEPVPRALVDTPAGEVFSRLVRMTDGAFHAQHRPAVVAHAAGFGDAAVDAAAVAAVRDLSGRVAANDLLTFIPVQAMARLLGVPADGLDRTVAAVHDFTRGIAAGADAQQVAAASAAAASLMAQGEREGLDRVRAANRIALMQQSLDATAGLLGNAIHALQAKPGAAASLGFVLEVAQRDPAIHNTRRFAAEDLQLAGERIAAGQGVLLLLASPGLGFGAGAHACPGERIALRIAAMALRELQVAGALAMFGPVSGYRPLPNARIPVFG